MGRGSPICERMRKKIVEYFKNLSQTSNCKGFAKVFHGQMSPNLTFLSEIRDAVSSGLKRRETFQRVISDQFKSQHLWYMGCIIAYGMGSLHVLEGTMNAERYIKVLEQHMLPSRRVYFSRTMQNHILQLRGGKSTKIFYSSKSTITLLKFYLSTSKSTSLKIYSSKSKK